MLALAACAAAGVAVVLPASGADSSPLRQRAQQLAQADASIAAHSRAAVLTLYALDSRLTRATAELVSLRARASALEQRRLETRRALAVAKRVFAASQRDLAERLRTAYEQGDSGPLAVVLAAKSLDEALSGIESVNAAAASDRSIVAQSRRAGSAYVRLERRLAARVATLHRLEAGVAATARAWASARAARTAYVARLAAKRRLNASQIATLESRARSIETEARQVSAGRTAVVDATPPATTTTAGEGRTVTVSATAYTLRGSTATGAPVGYGVVAVDPRVIPLGTRLTIPGYGEGVAADTGGSLRGAAIDLWFPSAALAAAWGRRTVTITLH